MAVDQAAYEAAKTRKTTKQVKQEADQACELDLDLTSKFDEGRQVAIAEGKAFLSGYHQGKLEIANFIKEEILAKPMELKSATYALPEQRTQSNIRALFYGDEDE